MRPFTFELVKHSVDEPDTNPRLVVGGQHPNTPKLGLLLATLSQCHADDVVRFLCEQEDVTAGGQAGHDLTGVPPLEPGYRASRSLRKGSAAAATQRDLERSKRMGREHGQVDDGRLRTMRMRLAKSPCRQAGERVAAMRSGCRLPAVRQQVFNSAGRLSGQPLEHILEVCIGLVPVDTC
ncbi:hypothetical protein WDL1P1_00581 (plasmid) [Variovorax sp. WDL1]|nr:hypothetical protein WDL1P1_00581 [Variovorax sp. WDL1]